MKIRILVFLTVLCLALAGCGREEASLSAEITAGTEARPTAQTTPRPVTEPPTLASREDHVTLTQFYEGEPWPVDCTLYRGSGFSLYLPDGDWELQGQDFWVFAHNEEVTLSVVPYEAFTEPEALTAVLEEEGFLRTGTDSLVQLEDGFRTEIFLLHAGDRVMGLVCHYPDSTEMIEGVGAFLPMILDSFLWE